MLLTESNLRKIIAEELEKLVKEARMSGKAYLRAKALKDMGVTKNNPNNSSVKGTKRSSSDSEDAQIPRKPRGGDDYRKGDD